MAGTLSVPQVNSPNSTEEAKIPTAISALNANLDGSNLNDPARLTPGSSAQLLVCNASGVPTYRTITNATVSNTGALTGVTDTALASPNNSVYRGLLTGGAYFGTRTINGSTPYVILSDGTVVAAGGTATTTTAPPVVFDYTSGDYTVASLTTRFRLKMEVHVGSTSPSATVLTAGLYPLTISAGNYTTGTVVAGSTAASSGLATNTSSRFNSGDFAASALLTDPGLYVIAVVVGTAAVPAGIGATVQLQTRNT